MESVRMAYRQSSTRRKRTVWSSALLTIQIVVPVIVTQLFAQSTDVFSQSPNFFLLLFDLNVVMLGTGTQLVQTLFESGGHLRRSVQLIRQGLNLFLRSSQFGLQLAHFGRWGHVAAIDRKSSLTVGIGQSIRSHQTDRMQSIFDCRCSSVLDRKRRLAVATGVATGDGSTI